MSKKKLKSEIEWVSFSERKPSLKYWSEYKLVTDGKDVWMDCFFAYTDDTPGFWEKTKHLTIKYWADLPSIPTH